MGPVAVSFLLGRGHEATMTEEATAAAAPDEDLVGWLRLTCVRGLGPRERTFLGSVLLRRPGLFSLDAASLEEALRTDLENESEGENVSLPGDVVEQLLFPRFRAEAEAQVARARELGIAIHSLRSESYPTLLREAPDPPFAIFARGALAPVPERTVSIVGSRRAGREECAIARELGRDLAAEGIVVVSGLARGVDRAAHEGALEAPGGRTVAVLGCGLARVYPSDHAALARAVLERGALLSELPADAPPRKHHFPQRNRVVSGIAKATVVVAAGEKSGALITAAHANDQNREVFAIPGRRDDPLAHGGNWLIRTNRAWLVEDATHVLERLLWKESEGDGRRPTPRPARKPPRTPLPGLLGDVEALLASGRPRGFEELARDAGLTPRTLVVALGQLQSLGRVRARGSLYELLLT